MITCIEVTSSEISVSTNTTGAQGCTSNCKQTMEMCKILSGGIYIGSMRSTGMKGPWREVETGFSERPGSPVTDEGETPGAVETPRTKGLLRTDEIVHQMSRRELLEGDQKVKGKLRPVWILAEERCQHHG